MTSRFHVAFAACIIGLTGAAGLGSIALGADAPKTGLYTDAQADKGLTEYEASCSVCHGANLEGGAGPVLLGQSFTSQHPHAGELLKYIAENMPQDNPASLSHDQYVEILAFILRKNGLPAGSQAADFDKTLTSQASTAP